jgi:hypothetical protein
MSALAVAPNQVECGDFAKKFLKKPIPKRITAYYLRQMEGARADAENVAEFSNDDTLLGAVTAKSESALALIPGAQSQNVTDEAFQQIVDELKVAKLRGDESIRHAVQIINRFQERYGNSRKELTRLADAVGVTTKTLYHWKRQVEQPTATPKKRASAPVQKYEYLIMRRKSDGALLANRCFANSTNGQGGFNINEVVHDADDLTEGNGLAGFFEDDADAEKFHQNGRLVSANRAELIKVTLSGIRRDPSPRPKPSDVELVKVTASYRLVVTP